MKSIDLHTQKQKKNVQEADLFCWKYIYGVGNKRYWSTLLIKYHFVTGFTFIYKQKDTLFSEVYMKMNCLCNTRDQTSQHTSILYSFRCSFICYGYVLWAQLYLCFVLITELPDYFQKNQQSKNSRCFPGENLATMLDIERVQIPN